MMILDGAQMQEYITKRNALSAKMMELRNSLPEQTTTVEEKENAIKVKNEIIKFGKEAERLARKYQDMAAASNFNMEMDMVHQEIGIIQGEINRIKTIDKANNNTITVA